MTAIILSNILLPPIQEIIQQNRKEAHMQIGNKEVKEIVIKDNTGELIADITDDDIISKTNIIVELISPDCCSC